MRLNAALVLVTLSVLVLGVLYLTGPERHCTAYTEIGVRTRGEPEGSGRACLTTERRSAWERISGAITGE